MLESFNNIINGNPEKVDNAKLYPLIIWFSGYYRNIGVCNFINKYFFFANPEILKGLLSLAVNKSQKYIKYPKSNKEEDEKLRIVRPYLKKIYGWSEREFMGQLNVINLNEEFLNWLNQLVGFSKSECRILGIKFETFKVERPKNIRQRSLF